MGELGDQEVEIDEGWRSIDGGGMEKDWKQEIRVRGKESGRRNLTERERERERDQRDGTESHA